MWTRLTLSQKGAITAKSENSIIIGVVIYNSVSDSTVISILEFRFTTHITCIFPRCISHKGGGKERAPGKIGESYNQRLVTIHVCVKYSRIGRIVRSETYCYNHLGKVGRQHTTVVE